MIKMNKEFEKEMKNFTRIENEIIQHPNLTLIELGVMVKILKCINTKSNKFIFNNWKSISTLTGLTKRQIQTNFKSLVEKNFLIKLNEVKGISVEYKINIPTTPTDEITSNLPNKDVLSEAKVEDDKTLVEDTKVSKKVKISNIKKEVENPSPTTAESEKESTSTIEDIFNLPNKGVLTPSTPEGDIVDQKQIKEPKKVDIKEEMITFIQKRDWNGPLIENINKNYQLYSELIEKFYKHNKSLFDRSKKEFLEGGYKYLSKKLNK